MRNPFSAGSWISGPDFIGRSSIIHSLRNSNENCDWVIAQRRMGKTSLLRRLEETINNTNTGELAIFWDIQGSYDPAGLLESLEDALDDSFDMYPGSWSDIKLNDIQADTPHQIIKNIARQLRRREMKVTLLIDEAEEFLTLDQKSPETLSRLRKTFHTSPNLHTIICSTPRLERLSQSASIETSPFLHGFHASYLGPFTETETLELLQRGNVPEYISKEIFKLTNGSPFQVQLFAKYYFESPSLDETISFMHSNPSLSQVHEVNLKLLKEEEQNVLFVLLNSSNSSVDDQHVLNKLKLLGYIASSESPSQPPSFHFASSFFRIWLKSYFNLNLDAHPQNEKDLRLNNAPEHLIRENIIHLYRFMLHKAQEGERILRDPTVFKISAQDKKVYPVQDIPISEPYSSSEKKIWHTIAKDLIHILKNVISLEDTWSGYRLNELCQKIPDTSEADLIDMMLLIREEAKLDS